MNDDTKLRKSRGQIKEEVAAREREAELIRTGVMFSQVAHTNPPKKQPKDPSSGFKNRAQAAETYAQRKYGRSRQEIDNFIRSHRRLGPAEIARQLKMKQTTVTMRMRALGL